MVEQGDMLAIIALDSQPISYQQVDCTVATTLRRRIDGAPACGAEIVLRSNPDRPVCRNYMFAAVVEYVPQEFL